MRSRQAYVLPGGSNIVSVAFPRFAELTRIISIVTSVETTVAGVPPILSLLVTTVGPTSVFGRWTAANLPANTPLEITFSEVPLNTSSTDPVSNVAFFNAAIPANLWLDETSVASLQFGHAAADTTWGETTLNVEFFR